ncbi:MAG TPA: toprim domain-containing protein [Candidatus Paceibacterota bacterium]|jgi:recombination protein RecR|nr:toprim domain-containing protein [Candidatus Paceibacterota bacterium]
MNDSLEKLTRLFLKFPGIGERQAKRFAYFILSESQSYVDTLSKELVRARGVAHTCEQCLRVFEGDEGLCSICADPSRDQSTIIVVEKSQDIEAFNRTDYHGLFFILGGLIPIIQKNVLEGTNVKKLEERIQKEKDSLTELILAFPLTPNGEHTDSVIRELLAPIKNGLTITSLGRGLSTGAELEYADAASLEASLKKRE